MSYLQYVGVGWKGALSVLDIFALLSQDTY